jgi:WD40 repeat protein
VETLPRETNKFGYKYSIDTVAFSPNGRWLATGQTNGRGRLWDVRTWKVCDAQNDGATQLAFRRNGKMLAGAQSWGEGGGVVYLWDITTQK